MLWYHVHRDFTQIASVILFIQTGVLGEEGLGLSRFRPERPKPQTSKP